MEARWRPHFPHMRELHRIDYPKEQLQYDPMSLIRPFDGALAEAVTVLDSRTMERSDGYSLHPMLVRLPASPTPKYGDWSAFPPEPIYLTISSTWFKGKSVAHRLFPAFATETAGRADFAKQLRTFGAQAFKKGHTLSERTSDGAPGDTVRSGYRFPEGLPIAERLNILLALLPEELRHQAETVANGGAGVIPCTARQAERLRKAGIPLRRAEDPKVELDF